MQDSILQLSRVSDTLHIAVGGAVSASAIWQPLLMGMIPALIVGGLTYLGVRHEIRQRKKEQELAVSREILARCLDALQGAYVEIMKLNTILNMPVLEKDQLSQEWADLRKRRHDGLVAIRDWYNSHFVYLPKGIRDQFLKPVHGGHFLVDESMGCSDTSELTQETRLAFIDLLKTMKSTIDAFMSKYDLLEAENPGK